jgi:glycogen synthase kinase 3 beta
LHPFFDELRDNNAKLPNGESLPMDLFEFTEEEYQSDPETVQKLIPDWIK